MNIKSDQSKVNVSNPKPDPAEGPGQDGEVGGEGRGPAEGSGGDGGDDSSRSGKPAPSGPTSKPK
jgi:hypothetical protein